MKLNKKLLIGSVASVALLAGGATSAFVFAQDTAGSTSVLSRVAQILGVSDDKLKDAVKQASTEKIDQDVKDGKIDSTKAEEIKKRIADGDFKFGMGEGPRGEMRKGAPLKEIAEYLGMEEKDLMTSLKDGKKLSDIITEKGKSVDEVKNLMKQKLEEKLKEQVSSGKMTQDEANKIIERESTMFDKILNGEMPKFKMRIEKSEEN